MPDRAHVRRRRPPARGHAPDAADGRLEALLRALPPVPERLMSRVLEVPRLESALAHLARDGGAARADHRSLRSALAAAGLEPDDRRVRMLRLLRRVRQDQEHGSEISPSRARDVR